VISTSLYYDARSEKSLNYLRTYCTCTLCPPVLAQQTVPQWECAAFKEFSRQEIEVMNNKHIFP
jgi:hypothetical protein